MRLRRAFIQEFSANKISTNLVCVSIRSRFSALLCLFPSIYLLSGVSCGSSSLRFRLFGSLQCSLFMIVRHICEISDDSRMRITTKSVHDRNDDFALRYVRIYPGVNSRAELVRNPRPKSSPIRHSKKCYISVTIFGFGKCPD